MSNHHETKIAVSSMYGTFDKDDDGLFQKKNQDLSLLLSKLSPYQWYSFEEQDQLLIMQGSVTGRFRDRYRYTYWQAESVKRAILDPLAKELNQLLSQDPFAPTTGMWQWPIIPTYKSVPVSSRLALVGHLRAVRECYHWEEHIEEYNHTPALELTCLKTWRGGMVKFDLLWSKWVSASRSLRLVAMNSAYMPRAYQMRLWCPELLSKYKPNPKPSGTTRAFPVKQTYKGN